MKPNYSTHANKVDKAKWKFSYKVYSTFLRMSILLNTEAASCIMLKLSCERPAESKTGSAAGAFFR